VRALRELGVRAEVAVAEEMPFSADPSYPPHVGRFVHPLVVAHLAGDDVWIDADVPGPPLPAGRISPELKGRSMLSADGTIGPVPALKGTDDRDEIDLRLAVDSKGDAKGSFTIVLRGREAQDLAEALFRIVGAERQRVLRQAVLAWVPFATVDEVGLSSSEESWQVAVRANVSAAGYAQAQGDAAQGATRTWVLPGMEALHFIVPRDRSTTLSAFFAGQGSRENALSVNTAVQYHVHRRVELPQGASAVRMPSPFELRATPVEASRRFVVNGAAVEDDFLLSVSTGTVPAAAYDAFVGDLRSADEAFLASTWFRFAP
jgi:hypothetical protein